MEFQSIATCSKDLPSLPLAYLLLSIFTPQAFIVQMVKIIPIGKIKLAS